MNRGAQRPGCLGQQLALEHILTYANDRMRWFADMLRDREYQLIRNRNYRYWCLCRFGLVGRQTKASVQLAKIVCCCW